MLGFLILLGVMIAIWVMSLTVIDLGEISKNWPKYRCQPMIMPFASFFGHDTNENFQFCLKGIFTTELGSVFSPIFSILSGFLGALGNLMNMANNMRLQFSTFMGGINTLIQNFLDRFKQLAENIRQVAMRMKMLFGRLFATFYSIIYMSMATLTAMQNFGDTVIFRFLDLFCFAPETEIDVEGKGTIAVKDVVIGDILSKTGSRVTSVFQFMADGQPMVEFPGGIRVSSNHYVAFQGSYIRSDAHPDAKLVEDWNGGTARPLICFNTNNHKIPVGNYVFLDYDETEEADDSTMAWVDAKINGQKNITLRSYRYDYTTVFSPKQRILSAETLTPKEAYRVNLGECLNTGEVIGKVYKEVEECCILPTGECVTPGSLIWHTKTNTWCRAGDLYAIQTLKTPAIFMNFIVKGTASIEFASGRRMRDYVEIHSPDTEQFYAKEIQRLSDPLPSYVITE
jgi:hypothetical protein